MQGVGGELRRVTLGGGEPAGVTGIPSGTSSSQVFPGCKAMGVPLAEVRLAGVVWLVRLQVPVMATPLRMTTRGPEPVAVTSTS